MTPEDIKGAQQTLGLSDKEFAFVLDTDGSTIRKMKHSVEASQYRKPAPRMVRLITAYLSGYRPDDWPE